MPLPPEFEEDVRSAMAVSEPEPAFLSRLRGQVSRGRAPRAGRFAWAGLAAAAVFLLAVILMVGPQTVFANFQRLLGYIPGVGVVQNDASLLVLAAPVKVEQDGVTVQVLEGAADPQHTVLVYQVDGIPQGARPTSEAVSGCTSPASLLTADGRELHITGGDGSGWGTGYDFRSTFPALPAGSAGGTLVIPCLQETLPGSVPENWNIPLQFKPAPADLKVFPVYDLPGAAPSQAQTTASPLPAAPAQLPSNAATAAGIRISLDQVVETENGFVLKGSTSWKGLENTVLVGLGLDTRLLEASGAAIPIEPYFPSGGLSQDYQTLAWGLETNNKAYPGPWKLSIPSVQVQVTGVASFELDLGPAPKLGQTWELNLPLDVAGHTLLVQKAQLTPGPGLDGTYYLDFTFSGGPEIFAVSANDPHNPSARISGKGSTAESGAVTSAFSYDRLPTGKRTIEVTSLTYIQQGPWSLGWQPPAASAHLATAAPLPQACLTPEKWRQIQSQPAGSLPQGIGGQMLVEQPLGGPMPQISLVDLATGQKQAIAAGAWSSLSPDGSRVAYVESNGKTILIAPTSGGQPHTLAGTTEMDYNPLWSPDGSWIAFTRSGAGIYLVHPDGSGLKRLTDSTLQAHSVGWMPDSRALVIGVQTASGEQAESVDIATGAVHTFIQAGNSKNGFRALSPDGRQAAFNERIFGQPYAGAWIANLDGSGRQLIAALDNATATVTAWSPDGKWVAVVVYQSQRDTTIETLLLVQPATCQVEAVPVISGTVTGWR